MSYGLGLHDQIEVHNNPTFYNKLRSELQKHPEIELSYPLTFKTDWYPQIIEIVGMTAPIWMNILIELWKSFKDKPEVNVRFKDGELVEVNSKNIKKLQILVEEE